MYFPQFLVGMLVTSFVTAIWVGIETGSVWTALGWAILAIVILQIGYVGLVVRLIYKRPSEGTELAQVSTNYTPPA
ncbi:hypothetical protein EN742_18945 [Mesorhizobium sp. M4A.F.Ca.ET.020.02.1.1]|uniref:hypothetical protein n=1 Tax=unclassified Mesorhizobium TaxID=325217 RepID=UPI000FCC8198|nr:MULTISPECIES: hypothetical protein [unclassified Mesorhizobium]RVD68725.1 hypothetical protein EN751_29865 [Mesorhizobium sp. M4A.F.Ca.ET.029.04.2.1]RUX45458.1 hypothetical protein EOA33_23990 [Mesorhizobium sp. M4A.F.Ca.ET.050.02.1.1]RVD37938.1 hypothetical protein EN742_18945 [Mesorhizobium sp. M4A.F.Ca.ET.020.02.1.1]RWC21637.1 MAG: hypothetical protein EOS53_04710 [Mesorhizobium sp.]RWD24921.1 MAG: hypothetical protein EOS22_21120 [Mesorhizobium sp.]